MTDIQFSPQDFYDILRENQEFVQNELAFMEMTQRIGDLNLAKGGIAVRDYFLELKEYWLSQFLIEIGDTSQLTADFKLLSAHNVTDASDRLELPLEQFAAQIAKVEVTPARMNDIDFLTFSVVPSLTRFFVFESDIDNKFLKLLAGICEADAVNGPVICEKLLRAIFRTPQFLFYVRKVIAPSLERIRVGLKYTSNEEDRMAIIRREVSVMIVAMESPQAQALFPSFINKIATSGVVSHIFSGAGQKILLRRFVEELEACPQKFLGWSYHNVFEQEFKFDDALIDALVESMSGSGSKKWSGISEELELIDPVSCSQTVLTARDNSVLNGTKLQKGDNPYDMIVFPLKVEAESTLDQLTKTQTMNEGMTWSMIRRLLKVAPELPHGVVVEEKEFTRDFTPIDFIEKWLVDRCDRCRTPIQEIANFRCARKMIRWTDDVATKAGLEDAFRKVRVQHRRTIRVLAQEKKLWQALQCLISVSRPAVAEIPKYVYCKLIGAVKNAANSLRAFKWGDATAYAHHPAAFHKLFDDWLARFDELDKQGKGIGVVREDIHFHYVCSLIGLDFEIYRAVNSHLQTYDAMLEVYMSRGTPDSQFKEERASHDYRDIMAFRMALAAGTDLQVEAYEMFRRNGDPLTKAEEFNLLIKHVVENYQTVYSLSDRDVGFDLSHKLQRIFYIYGFNPTCLASFYGYLNDFILARSRELAECDNIRALAEIVRRYSGDAGFQTWMLSRLQQVDKKLTFIGSLEQRATVFKYLADVDTQLTQDHNHFSAVTPVADGSLAFVFEVFCVPERGTCSTAFTEEVRKSVSVLIGCLGTEPLAQDGGLKSDLAFFPNVKVGIFFDGTERSDVQVTMVNGKPCLVIPKGKTDANTKGIILGQLQKYLTEE